MNEQCGHSPNASGEIELRCTREEGHDYDHMQWRGATPVTWGQRPMSGVTWNTREGAEAATAGVDIKAHDGWLLDDNISAAITGWEAQL